MRLVSFGPVFGVAMCGGTRSGRYWVVVGGGRLAIFCGGGWWAVWPFFVVAGGSGRFRVIYVGGT